MDRVIRSAPASIATTLYDANGDPVTAGGAVTATVKDSAGTAIAGSPFGSAEAPTGTYTATIPTASLGVLDVYDVTWNLPGGQTRASQFEVVGNFLFSVAEARLIDAQLADVDAGVIREYREAIEERFEAVAHVSFTRRGHRARLNGSAGDSLLLEHLEAGPIVSASVGGSAVTLSELQLYPSGELVWDGGWWTPGFRNVEVLYEHGFITPPAPVHGAALKVLKAALLEGPFDSNARATAVINTDIGGYRLSIAGRDGPFGLPDVDAILSPAQFGRMPASGLA